MRVNPVTKRVPNDFSVMGILCETGPGWRGVRALARALGYTSNQGRLRLRLAEHEPEEQRDEEQEREDVHAGAPEADRVDLEQLGPEQVQRHEQPDAAEAQSGDVQDGGAPAQQAGPAEDQHDGE